MISYNKRIDRAYEASPRFLFDDRAKIVLMSDCHRGVGNLGDDFAKNKNAATRRGSPITTRVMSISKAATVTNCEKTKIAPR